MPEARRRHKYGAVRTELDGIVFASKAEARHYAELKLRLAAGEISCLRLQVPFVLAPGVKFDGDARAKPALRFLADFVYRDRDGRQVVADVKGKTTEAYRIKRHLMLAVHGIQVLEVRSR